MWDVQAKVHQSLKHCDTALRIKMSGNHVHGFVEQPNPSVLFDRSIYAGLSRHLQEILVCYRYVLGNYFTVNFDHAFLNEALTNSS